jgi:hypothetical protein
VGGRSGGGDCVETLHDSYLYLYNINVGHYVIF